MTLIEIIDILRKFGIDIQLPHIEERYAEPHRFYHIFTHIEFLIEKIDELFRKGIINEDERDILIVAALFHDIVYNPQRSDNEEKSVEFMKEQIRYESLCSAHVVHIFLTESIQIVFLLDSCRLNYSQEIGTQ